VVLEAERATRSLLDERKVAVKVDDGTRETRAVADSQRLRNVLENLIANAANASKEGATVEIRTRRSDDGRVVIEIADQGHGIAPADLPRIFEPFFTTRADGTGLGLAICDKLVRAQNGEIRVDSSAEGTTFSVYLPAEDPDRSAERVVTSM
jgi:signal transduction histidine kinase